MKQYINPTAHQKYYIAHRTELIKKSTAYQKKHRKEYREYYREYARKHRKTKGPIRNQEYYEKKYTKSLERYLKHGVKKCGHCKRIKKANLFSTTGKKSFKGPFNSWCIGGKSALCKHCISEMARIRRANMSKSERKVIHEKQRIWNLNYRNSLSDEDRKAFFKRNYLAYKRRLKAA